MIADKIDAYLRTEGSAVSDALLDTAAAHVRRSLARNFGARREHRSRVPSPSSKWFCARRQLYDSLPMGGEREAEQPRARIIFTLGDSVEAVAMLLARQAGVQFITPDVGGTQLRLSAKINPADFGLTGDPFPIAGNMDCTIEVDGHGECPADWKSMSEYGYDDAVAAARNPAHKWWVEQADDIVAQVRWYMILLRLAGRGTGGRGFVLGVGKSTGHTCELVIERDDEAERTLVKRAQYVWNKLRSLQNFRDGETAAKGLEFVDLIGFSESLNSVDLPRALDFIQREVPRPAFAQTVLLTGANERGDGTKGPVEQIDTARDSKRHGNGPFVGWRCGYCPFTAACWPGFTLVPLGKPVWRRAAEAPTK